MALTYTESGNNTASGSWAVSHPAAATGDLLIFNIGWDDSTTTTGLTPPAGPNSETAVVVEDVTVSSNTAVRGKVVYYVATGTWSASTISFTPSADEQWSAVVIKVPAGEFDPTTPVGADNAFSSTGTDATPDLPSLTAGSTDGGGTVVGFMVGDVDDPDGTITGWTERASTDRGAVGVGLWTRDTVATNSESIAAATGATFPSARDYVSFIYIIRAVPQTSPTVALNSPADASSDSDTTPTLTFTGTDDESDDVTYQIQISSVSNFTPIGTVIDSYSESNHDGSFYAGNGTTKQEIAQSLTGNGQTVSAAKFYIKKGVGSPTGNITARIFAHTGTFGTSSAPTGAQLNISDVVDASTVTSTTPSLFTFNFSGANQITLANGTKYVMKLVIPNNISVAYDATTLSHGGNYWSDFDGAQSGWDVPFYLYDTVSSDVLLDKVSDTDAGFTEVL